ncbi:uncharacterized protein RJT21DRAFT_119259 [Scheffersomyces amazonensis]|uniref:uncharacterized protein n=1 Tax=Scheffersomyces amazonensis TaxID=1078765 RepID=UPI00315DA80B
MTFKSYFARYNKLIQKKPLITNMITTGMLFGSGDILAQTLFKGPNENNSSSFDLARLLRAVVYGSIIFAPIGDKWYKLLNKIKFPSKRINSTAKVKLEPVLHVSSPKPSIKDTILRVTVDQLVFAPFIGIPLYYTVMTLFEMETPILDTISNKLSLNWWNTLATNWLVWPIFQLFNFYLLPVHYRLLAVNSFSIGWNCYLSYVLNRKDIGTQLHIDIVPDPKPDGGNMIF